MRKPRVILATNWAGKVWWEAWIMIPGGGFHRIAKGDNQHDVMTAAAKFVTGQKVVL